MVIGQIVGIIRMVLDFINPSPKCGTPDTRPSVVAKVHFTYFSAGLLVFTAMMVVILSLITKRPVYQVCSLYKNYSLTSNFNGFFGRESKIFGLAESYTF